MPNTAQPDHQSTAMTPTQQLKQQIFSEVATGKRLVSDIARQYNLPTKTIFRWIAADQSNAAALSHNRWENIGLRLMQFTRVIK